MQSVCHRHYPKRRRLLALHLAVAAACSLSSTAAWSQVPPPGPGIFIARSTVTRCMLSGPEGLLFPSGQPTTEKVGPAYSAVGITDVVNTLPDGNRIVRQNIMRYFRDSSGRTRTEFDLGTVGPVPVAGKHVAITINDPVANARYILTPELKQATVLDSSIGGPFGVGVPNQVIMTRRMEAGPTSADKGPARDVVVMHNTMMGPGPGPMPACSPDGKGPVSLGERVIDGFKTVGSRLEVTIPAGEIGNELPITTVTEQWFSPELGVVLASTHHDPMSGDTTYKLTQISRAEPDASLFVVPADYTRTAPGPFQKFEVKLPPPGAPPAKSRTP